MNKKIIMWIFFLIIVAVLLFVVFRQGGLYESVKFEGCINTGGDIIDGECSCSVFFPIYNQDTGKCQNEFGESPASLEILSVLEERVNFVHGCQSTEGNVYVVPNTPVTFCYDMIWGAPKVELVANSAYKLSFIDVDTKLVSALAPVLYYYSVSEAIPEDVPQICYSCLDFSLEEPELKNKLGLAEQVEIKKMAVDSLPALRVNDGKMVTYYVPDSFDHNHLILTVSEANAIPLDSLITFLWFDWNAD